MFAIFLIAASKEDPAGLNIAQKLIKEYGFKRLEKPGSPKLDLYRKDDVQLVLIEGPCTHASQLSRLFPVEAVVFASKHRSESLEPTLTVHVPGNLTSEAKQGGRPRELAWAWPQRMRKALLALMEGKNRLPSDFRVSLEATHHGPTELDVPVWFVEIGSSEAQWKNDEAGRVAADAVWASLGPLAGGRAAVGFGGGHYSPKHTEFCAETDYAIGHIFPKYAFASGIDDEVLAQAFSKTWGECHVAVVDWKGLQGGLRRVLLEKLEVMGVGEIVKI